ncbi:MAG: hypothetical protein AAFN13_18750, partial [Bacteroidota bacterium]
MAAVTLVAGWSLPGCSDNAVDATKTTAAVQATEVVPSRFVHDELLLPTARTNALEYGAVRQVPAGPGLVDLLVDVQWDGSWRNPHNWDAAWTFVKFRAPDGRWKHASLAPQGHALSPQAGAAPTPAGAWTWAPDSTGLWLHRAAASSPGPNRWTARLRWAAGADGAAAGAEVRVLGLEMVYVPAGAFYAGDGVSVGAFEGVGGEPVRIDS